MIDGVAQGSRFTFIELALPTSVSYPSLIQRDLETIQSYWKLHSSSASQSQLQMATAGAKHAARSAAAQASYYKVFRPLPISLFQAHLAH